MKSQFTLILSLLISANFAFADGLIFYEVSITNVTKGQSFTPQLVATHDKSLTIFTLGEAASASLEALAEGGDTSWLEDDLSGLSGQVKVIDGLLGPGDKMMAEIKGHHNHHSLSIAAMLLPTNDTFVALSAVELPKKGSVSYLALAYDAGTEENDQSCMHIPGPTCEGQAFSAINDETDEGYVYISNGIHDSGDLDPALYDWNNAVALVTIKRINE